MKLIAIRCNPDFRDFEGKNSLMIAAEKGHVDIVQELLLIGKREKKQEKRRREEKKRKEKRREERRRKEKKREEKRRKEKKREEKRREE